MAANPEHAERDHCDLDLLYHSNHYDSVLKCQGKEFRVHRAVLETESDYFRALFSGPWKENADGVVHLDSTETDVLEQGLRCMYARTSTAVEEPHKNDPMFIVRLYLFFDGYLAESLRKQAYQDCCTLFKCSKIRLGCPGELQKFAHIVDLVLANTRRSDTGLRPAVIQLCAQKFKTFGYRFEQEPKFTDGIEWKLVEPDRLESQQLHVDGPKSTVENGNRNKISIRALLSSIIATIKAEEPNAWNFAMAAVIMEQNYEHKLAAADSAHNVTSTKLLELRRAEDKAELSSRLLRKHTYCRRVECGVRLDLAGLVFGLDGNLVELRCKKCNTRHGKA